MMPQTEENLPVAQPATSVAGNQTKVTGDYYNCHGPVTIQSSCQIESHIANQLQRTTHRMLTQPSADGDTSGVDVDQETESSEADLQLCGHNSRCLLRDKKKRKRNNGSSGSQSRSSSERRKENEILNTIPNAAFQCLRYDICEAISEPNLKKLKGICVEDFRKHGLKGNQLENINTAEEFFNFMQRCHLFSEDNLFFVQWCLAKLGLTSAYEDVEEYAQKREEIMETQPLVLFKRRGKSFGKDVEFRIKGNIRHMHMTNVNAFKAVISKRLMIPERYINVRALGNGSIIIVLQMPELGVNRLREAVARKDAWLLEEKILEIHIEGEDCVIIQDEYAQNVCTNTMNGPNDAIDTDETVDQPFVKDVTTSCIRSRTIPWIIKEAPKYNSGLVICSSSSSTSSMKMQNQIQNIAPVLENLETQCAGMMTDEELEDVVDSCNDVFESTATSSMPSPMSSHTIPTTCASSTPITIPSSNPSTHHSSPSNNHNNHRRLSGSGTTPSHHNSYLMCVSPWAPCEPNSPTSLSPGYGSSSPRLLTASTQTPPMLTFDIRLRVTNSPVNSASIHRSPSADLRREHLRRQILHTSHFERRHSERSRTDAGQATVVKSAFRPRANTEPLRPRPEIAVGEQLRIISEEFHVSYEENRRLRRRRENQGWLSRVIEHFRGRPHHEEVEQPQAVAAAEACQTKPAVAAAKECQKKITVNISNLTAVSLWLATQIQA
ncbi:uncharacterized protein [Amphiura filiformis]|uniref:uncharacterized protein n=1 Tax=Amphiura filiformis TaxID=82378 RepID=UPI003B21BFE7